ncbi:uncharacterized protein LOC121735016 [Aricia agestis]|uniref:uncharacterized protein LOC121735016 n=1 Tax=Aricia agestis TaxID=91739 RepID=UPI001C203313|nr:uncharacterized protein LOC121735016 [Aricia agestis]
MTESIKNIWRLILVFALCGCVLSVTDEEAKQQFLKTLLQCTKKHPVEMADLLTLQKHMIPTKPDVKCLLACTYRELGTLDKDGKYNLTRGYEIAETMREGDDKRVQNGKKMADVCAKVNDEAVGDGSKGCDRATLLFKCTIETAPKFGFKIAMNDAEAREKFMVHAMECNKDNSVQIADLEPLQQLKTPTKTEVKCLLACVYRAIGTLGANGKFDLQKSYELAEKMKDGDEKRLENGKKVADICIKVNDEAVSDGEKGCDRAALMFECVNKNAPQHGFKLM